MEFEFSQLSRMPQRPEKEPEVEVEIWQPGWQCYCCHDTGIIVPHLVRKLILDYNENRDKFPRCSKPGCSSGEKYDSEALYPSTDRRIDAFTCKKLDEFERQTWRDTLFVHGQRAKQSADELARDMSLRKRDRTEDEQLRAEENHKRYSEN